MKIKNFLIFSCLVFTLAKPTAAADPKPPSNPKEAFVSISDVDPSIVVETRYFGNHNFIGSRIRGYKEPKCLLTREAAQALVEVQNELKEMSLSLKVYDCYRPRRAVDHFVKWAKNLSDTKMKNEFYPRVDKANLFKDGYIAEKSSHSRGSTLDLTIISFPAPSQETYREGEELKDCSLPADQRWQDKSIDMGTGYDCFDPLSHTANQTIEPQQRANRLLLKTLMEKHGFKNLPEEWWHYTLKQEPFSDTSFNFEVK